MLPFEKRGIAAAPLRSIRASFCAVAIVHCTLLAAAAAQTAPIAGCVTRSDGSPIRGAAVSAQSPMRDATTTDERGCFRLQTEVEPVTIRVDATGFAPFVRSGLRAGGRLDITLAPATSSLVTLGRVDVDGRGSASTSSAPSVTVDAQRAAENGFQNVAEIVSNELSVTAIRPVGGGANAPRVFALRGPDPTETLVDIDGHEINNGNTGDFDLSLLDPEDLQNVELVYGVAPSSLVGPNTIGGAINLRTLEPTQTPRGLARVSAGSYGLFGTTLQSTGTSGRIGYALSLHRLGTDNEIHDRTIAFAGDNPGELAMASVGSGSGASSALGKIRYAVGPRATDGFVELSFRDQSIRRDESAALSSSQPDGTFASFAGSFVESHDAGYGLDLRLPVGGRDSFGNAAGSITFRHFSSTANQSVFGPVADSSSAYFFNDRDAIGDDTLQYDRIGATTSFSLKAALRTEELTEPFAVLAFGGSVDQVRARRTPGLFGVSRSASDTANGSGTGAPGAPAFSSLSQTQRSFVARYAFDAVPRVHATLATYYSNFTTFGTSLDPRIGVVWTPASRTAVRASFGTTFQSPALTELFVPDPLPDASNTLVHIGNPDLKADHATEYDLGIDQIVGGARTPFHLGLDLYRTNLRTPSQTFVPASGVGYTFPVNVGGAVYQGIEVRAERDLVPGTRLRLGYSIDSAYPTSVPADIGGASLVRGEQFLGVPLQRGIFSVDHDPRGGFSYSLGGSYEGHNNELNQPPFVVLHGSIGYGFNNYRIDVSGQNLTNVYAFGFTRAGAGVPYIGADGPIPLDAYAIPAGGLSVSLSRHF